MEPGGSLEERADVTRQKLLNYIKFRREEEKLKFKLGVKGGSLTFLALGIGISNILTQKLQSSAFQASKAQF